MGRLPKVHVDIYLSIHSHETRVHCRAVSAENRTPASYSTIRTHTHFHTQFLRGFVVMATTKHWVVPFLFLAGSHTHTHIHAITHPHMHKPSLAPLLLSAHLSESLGGGALCERWHRAGMPCWGNEDGCPRVGRAACFVASRSTIPRLLEAGKPRHNRAANRYPGQESDSLRRDSLSLN